MSYDVLKNVPPSHSAQVNCWWEDYKEIDSKGDDVLALEDSEGNEYLSYSVKLTKELSSAEDLYLHVSEHTTDELHSSPMENGVVFDAEGRLLQGGKAKRSARKGARVVERVETPNHIATYFVGMWITVDFHKMWGSRHKAKTHQGWINTLRESTDQPGLIDEAPMNKLMEIAEDYDKWIDACVQSAVEN